MPIPPRRLARRVAVLIRQREILRSQAAAFTLRYYRTYRRLPAGYVITLLASSTIRRIRLRGEIEHLLGIPRVMARLKDVLK